MTGVFVQVRIGSSRLPRKALIELAGRPMIEHAMRSLARLPATVHALLTDEASAGRLESLASTCGFHVFAGPEDHVLERYVLAARHFGVDEIVRATGDNPLVSWELARLAVADRRRLEADFLAYDGPPLGTGVEVVRAAALEVALEESRDRYDAEHVSPFLYRNPQRFRCVRLKAPPAYCYPEGRVTVDTQEDFLRIATLMREVYDGSPLPAIRLVHWFRANEPLTESEDVCAARA